MSEEMHLAVVAWLWDCFNVAFRLIFEHTPTYWLAFHFFEDEKLDKVNLWCAVGGYKWFAYRTVKEHKDFFFHLTMNNDLIASLNPIFSCAPLYVLVSESQFCADN